MATTTSPLVGSQQHAPRSIAPLWHTLLLVVFLLVFSAMGAGGHQALDRKGRLIFYGMTISIEWIMVAYIAWGLHRSRRSTLRELIGGRWTRVEDFLLDIVVAIGFWIVAGLVLAALGFLLGMNNIGNVKELQRRIDPMLPDGLLEIVGWVAVSATAGFCEEIIFRGYFQKQFALLLNAAWAGIVLQGLIFGGSHAYEGWRQMVRIAVFGMLFGALAHLRKSLRPGMMAHFAQDTVAGLLARTMLKHADKVLNR
jgi:membrane protease YdiL (CAAX protease family)